MENNNSNTNTAFAWTTFYSEFADKLLLFKNNRTQLLLDIKDSYDSLGMKFPFMDNGELLDDICPFTVFGCFNKGITNDNRIALMKSLGSKLGVISEVPTQFDGIPFLNNLRAWFFEYKKDRYIVDISNLWVLFEAAIAYADRPSDITQNAFIISYDKVRKQPGIKWNITMGLYWIRPYSYLNLDERNRSFLIEDSNPYTKEILNITNFKQVPTAQTYLNLISLCKTFFIKKESTYKSFLELSYCAWKSTSIEPTSKKISTASFLKWFTPIVNALKELGGSGTPEQVRNQIISNLNLPDENETRGKTGTKKFDNEIAFARNYLAYEDFIDKSIRGIWKLTENGMTAPINEEIASEIFYKWMEINKRKRIDTEEPLIDTRNEIKYWLYAPGESSSFWDEFYTNNIIGIGWDDMGDLEQYKSKDSMKTKMKELYGEDYSYMNQALATWQFVNEMQIGDIVYVKKGIYKIIGRGIVESNYIYDSSRNEYTHTRKMNWTNNGEWDHPGKAAMKTLTDITYYTDYVQKLETLFLSDDTETEAIFGSQYSLCSFVPHRRIAKATIP